MFNKCFNRSLTFVAALVTTFVINETVVASGATDYTLKSVAPETLLASTVMVQSGNSYSTGIAVGPRHFITAAHAIGSHKLAGKEVCCYHPNSNKPSYSIETIALPHNEGVEQVYAPRINPEDFEAFEIIDVILHPLTKLVLVDEKGPRPMTIPETLQRYTEVMGFGLESAETYASQGVHNSYYNILPNGDVEQHLFRAYGPDIAILVCKKEHGIPAIPISDPVTDERLTLHVSGFSGQRYAEEDSSKLCAGCALWDPICNAVVIAFQPRICAQRFRCLQADAEQNYFLWMNRPFMRKSNGKFIFESEVYPNAPAGFGLIAEGDSGAGVIIEKDGKPLLVGIVSTGEIDPIFKTIYDYAEQVPVLKPVVEKAIKATVKEEKWFMTQACVDLTHLKDWVKEQTEGI